MRNIEELAPVLASLFAKEPRATWLERLPALLSADAADFSPEMLDRARERFAGVPEVEVVEHDFDAPLPDDWGSFDAVVSVKVRGVKA